MIKFIAILTGIMGIITFILFKISEKANEKWRNKQEYNRKELKHQ